MLADLDHEETASTRKPTGLHWQDVPILINSYNRLNCLGRLIGWLQAAGYHRIYVIDNNSSYRPLRAYLSKLASHRIATVIRLANNIGHLALWRHNLLAQLGIDTEFVYSDPDIVPAACCPADVVAHLQSVLAGNPELAVAGLGLRLDDLPDEYRYKSQAIGWERQFWLAPAASGLFHAPIDTTFALYRPRSGHCLAKPAIRTGWPCVAAHTSWYVNQAAPAEEDTVYAQTAARDTSHWSVSELPGWLAKAACEQTGAYPDLVSVAPAGVRLPGYRSVDGCDDSRGFSDGAYAVDSLLRLSQDQDLRQRLQLALKPGGRLVVHERGVATGVAAAILRREAPWVAGWRLRTMVASADRSTIELAASGSTSPLEQLMLHLEPSGPAAPPDSPCDVEFRSANLDHWPGFTAIGGASASVG